MVDPNEVGMGRDGAVAMFGALPIGLFRATREGVLLVVNDALSRILGVSNPNDLIRPLSRL